MKKYERGFSVYGIIGILAFIGLIIILALPLLYNVQKTETTELCHKNQRMILKLTQRYLSDPDIQSKYKSKTGSFEVNRIELTNWGYEDVEKVSCPDGKESDKYLVYASWKTLPSGEKALTADSLLIPEIDVYCPNYLKYADLLKIGQKEILKKTTQAYMSYRSSDFNGIADELVHEGFLYDTMIDTTASLLEPEFRFRIPEAIMKRGTLEDAGNEELLQQAAHKYFQEQWASFFDDDFLKGIDRYRQQIEKGRNAALSEEQLVRIRDFYKVKFFEPEKKKVLVPMLIDEYLPAGRHLNFPLADIEKIKQIQELMDVIEDLVTFQSFKDAQFKGAPLSQHPLIENKVKEMINTETKPDDIPEKLFYMLEQELDNEKQLSVVSMQYHITGNAATGDVEVQYKWNKKEKIAWEELQHFKDHLLPEQQ